MQKGTVFPAPSVVGDICTSRPLLRRRFLEYATAVADYSKDAPLPLLRNCASFPWGS